MSIYSKALRHIDMKDVKKKHQQKLIDQKIQRKLEREEKKYIQSVMETKKYDWRKKLNEQMTTSDVFFTTLNPPENTYDNPIVTSPTASISYANAINSNTRLITLGTFDLSSIDQFEVNATRLGSGGDSYAWVLQANGTVIAAGGANDPIRVANASELALFKSGNTTLTIRQSTSSGEAPNPSITGWTINNVKFYRTVPTNVFVSLNSPEATSFIRSEPNLSNLSPQERLQKLKDMLEASDEYVMKILGVDFPGTGAVSPSDYDPFSQAPPGQAGDTPGVEIAQLYPSDYNMERNTDLMLLKGLQRGDYGTGPDIDRQIKNIQKNLQQGTPGGLPQASAGKDTQIAQVLPIEPAQQRKGTTGVGVPDTKNNFIGPQPYQKMNYPKEWLPKQAKQSVMPMVASYEPEGQVISEKRKLKSPQELLNKIPGYYDGKPAPLGFPVEQPPKMVNGMHPDLVDGKKVSDRFNRLDPESAKATPLTGNPHIDRKIKAARKQPK